MMRAAKHHSRVSLPYMARVPSRRAIDWSKLLACEVSTLVHRLRKRPHHVCNAIRRKHAAIRAGAY
jgi:hypothetical protein